TADACGLASGSARVRVRMLDLRYLRARGAFLANVDMQGANLIGADFTDAVLCRASAGRREGRSEGQTVLRGAVLQRADLRFANFERVNFDGADLEGVRLDGAHLAGASLRYATLRDAATSDPPSGRIDQCPADPLDIHGADATCS